MFLGLLWGLTSKRLPCPPSPGGHLSLCVSVCLSPSHCPGTHVSLSRKAQVPMENKGIRYPGAEVTGSYGPTSVGAGNQIQVPPLQELLTTEPFFQPGPLQVLKGNLSFLLQPCNDVFNVFTIFCLILFSSHLPQEPVGIPPQNLCVHYR